MFILPSHFAQNATQLVQQVAAQTSQIIHVAQDAATIQQVRHVTSYDLSRDVIKMYFCVLVFVSGFKGYC